MQRRFFMTCALVVILSACAPAKVAPSLVPTLTPVQPTTVQPMALPTDTATSSPTPENSPTPAATPSLEPTITETLPSIPTPTLPPTLEATSLPQPAADSAAIQIFGPGPLSKLVSPMVVYGYAIPGYGHLGKAFLYGEDGRLLGSKLLQLNTAFTWAYFYGTLPFEVQGAGELGRLTMTTQDRYGRFTAMNSVHLILLPEGFSIINPLGDVRERCIIEHPLPGRRNAGGMLTVAGEMRPYNSLPLEVELIDRNGHVIASQAAAISPASDDSYVPFVIGLPYSIPMGTWVLLVVRQPDDRIAGTMYLYSREIYLYP